jgi:hypothetical protein
MTSNEQPSGSAIVQGASESQSAQLGQLRVPNLAPTRDAIRTELSQIAKRAADAARGARRRAGYWGRLYFVVGLPAAGLAAVAGATALASPNLSVFAGIIAVLSAVLTAVATFLDSATRQTSANNVAAGWQVLSNDAQMRLVLDVQNDYWLVRESRGVLEDMANRERKLLEGKAPDAEAEAERRADYEKMRAQAETARAEALADQARAAEQALRQPSGAGPQLGALATGPKATALQPPQSAVAQSPESSELGPPGIN